MTDLFGYVAPRPAFVDIRNQRPSVAEEKAALCLTLGELCKRVPESIRSADIRKTREWMANLERAKKILSSKRASINDLTVQIAQMRSWVAN